MNAPSSAPLGAIERARYKLQQAHMILGNLLEVPAQIAIEMRRARQVSNPDIRLDTYFFACLSLAKSAYYIIEGDQGGSYEDAIHSWRMNVLDYKGRTQFNRMMKLRDIDVHQGKSESEMLGTMIPMEPRPDAWLSNNAALGIPRHATEYKTPDGSTASSYDGLQGTQSLYIWVAGDRCEGSKACERFISQLSQMIAAVEAANVPPLGPLQRLWLWFRSKLGIRD
jgi:hypothetical protein